MTDPIDAGLTRLRTASLDSQLDRLEAAVLGRLERQDHSNVFRGRAIQVQLAVSGAALILGLLMAEFVQDTTPPMQSETAVLSDDSALAPSVRLAGGA